MRFLFCALMGAALLCAADTAKEQPPAGGPPKPFHLPKSEDFTLPNGMRVTLTPYGQVPKVAIRAYVNAGGINEAPNQVWLSRLTGLLMQEGTKSRSAEAVADAAADAGGQLEIEAGVEFTTVGGVVLSDHASEFIELLADVLEHPLLPASEVDRLKANLNRELSVERAKPEPLARERFLQAMFPNSAYGRVMPAESDLKSYSINDVTSFYQTNFGAARTHVYVAGKLDEGLRAAIEKAFGGWSKGAEAVHPAVEPVKAHAFSLIDRPNAPQSTLYVGLPVPGPNSADYVRLDVLNSLLGGSFASRITANIREQKGYTYSPFSVISPRRHLAYWAESADVTTAVTGPSLKEIFYEVNRLRKEAPPAAELQGIQNYLAGIFVLRNTISPDAVINQLHFVDSQEMDRSYLTTYVQKVTSVSPAEVQGTAEKYLAPDKMAIVVVGDKSKIAEQLKPYEEGTF